MRSISRCDSVYRMNSRGRVTAIMHDEKNQVMYIYAVYSVSVICLRAVSVEYDFPVSTLEGLKQMISFKIIY